MGKDTKETVKNLITLLSSSGDLARTRACKSLIALGAQAVPFLVEALRNSTELGRWEAAKALSQIGDSAAAPALVEALEDEEFEVRWRAAEGLTKMGVKGLKPLLQALTKDAESVSLRETAHYILHNVGEGDPRNSLLPVLNALEGRWPSVEVPAAALRAIEGLEKYAKMHGEIASVSLKEFIPATPNQPADLGARKRARRYAKSLQSRTI